MTIRIRQATIDDLEAMTEIYNDAILNTMATFDVEPKSIDDRRQWFESLGIRYPILVVEYDGHVVGWACLTRWSDRLAYKDTAEASCYIKKDFRTQGIGFRLAQKLLEMARQRGFHTVIARVTTINSAGLELCRKLGFEHIGVMKEVGKKFGQLLDVDILQILLDK